MPLLIASVITTFTTVRNVLYINVVGGQNIFQVWNIPHPVHPIQLSFFKLGLNMLLTASFLLKIV